ncbi:inter-alpha-trypsin inhibitor heavy chain H6 isoform X2 [Salmo salar]|uniref:Inter-alpha-trypsin inhibitor heavy chain H6 isoform X2 n=1 Tax=Salmo salar TaxID=8030 RepID=A0A1S3MH84_SALSA|nr:inter-alpha-trypsin inhibitor heavy chain H6 isoform X2 [Salmo salar]|eukprot:XP_014002439.1 PREDICTED: inter-alpha-trypsin inhibitor heavy chain H6-like isoform X2 [Salmo salar]
MTMGKVDLKTRCIFFFIIISVQRGFSEEFVAHQGAKDILLQRVRRQSKAAKSVLKVTDYHVRCSVVSRYAHITIQSAVWNQLPVTKEAAFEVDLPSAAFISNFTITSNDKVYIAQVKERSAARKIYDAAKKQGKTAGLVATKEREIEKFRVAVSVPSGTQMSFSLSYEELLPRRLGRYELTLGLRPGGLVTNLTLDVSIAERTGLSFIKVLPLKTSRLLSNTVTGESEAPASTQVQQNPCCARVHYSPSLQQQSSASSKGLNADYIIQYDVELSDLIGDIQVFDGYFVHYFAPRGLPVVPKDVIFVIDVSGSMIGTKIKQTKQAMSTILGDLREEDHFNIITFSDKVHTWKKGRTVRATRSNIRDAKDFVKRIIAKGWTNINAALLSAAQLVNPPSSSGGTRRVPLIIFLTDGEATIGVTSGDFILSNAKSALGATSLFGLAFGDDADFPLLRRLALDNRGVARMVYEDADAALQLKGFYDEVASPLLSDIQLTYMDDQAFDVTRSLFPNYFQGSELVVTGKVKPGVRDLKVSLTASGSKQKVKVENEVLVSNGEGNRTVLSMGCPGGMDGIPSFVRRLWAYFTIKELLLAKLNTTDSNIQKLLGEKATNLSLKYNFVTPVTSLVVVKPDADEIPTSASTTTVRPTTTTATTTTTVAHTPATNIASPIPVKNPRMIKAKPDPLVTKPPPLQPPQPRKGSTPPTKPNPVKTVAPPSPKKTTTTTTPSPSAVKTVPVPLSGKNPTPPPSSPKTASAPPARIVSTPLPNLLKTDTAPAPGKTTTTTTQRKTVKTTVPTTVKTTTSTTTTTSVRADPTPAPQPGKPTTPLPISVRTVLPPVRISLSASSSSDNATMSAADANQPQVTTHLYSLKYVPPTLAPHGSNTDTDPDVDQIATFVSATFAPMPGVTDGPKLWEAAGLLDMEVVNDYDATYDYDLDYDSWDESASNPRPGPPSRLSSVRVFSSSVDGDPHFVVQLPKLKQNLCFTVDGRANDVLRLLEDPERGIMVDGHLMWAPSKQDVEDRSRTYFDQITISTRGGTGVLGAIMITLSLDAVVVEGEGRDTLHTNQEGSVTRQGVMVSMESRDDFHQSCWIELTKNIHFLVLFHHYKQPSYLQMAHLGFYITDGQGLSPSTKGLLGQFQHADMRVTLMKDPRDTLRQPSKERVLSRGVLRWGVIHMPVTLQDKTLKDTVRKGHLGSCWVVPKAQVERLLGHPYQSYVVDHL